jgi:hypothetical protein
MTCQPKSDLTGVSETCPDLHLREAVENASESKTLPVLSPLRSRPNSVQDDDLGVQGRQSLAQRLPFGKMRDKESAAPTPSGRSGPIPPSHGFAEFTMTATGIVVMSCFVNWTSSSTLFEISIFNPDSDSLASALYKSPGIAPLREGVARLLEGSENGLTDRTGTLKPCFL